MIFHSEFQRGEQRVSTLARSILTVFFLCVATLIILAFTDVVHWLDFLYACSYIKLCITLIKYMPQAFMNYRRKSTSGWSIGNVLLDFTGGWLSILQMLINAYNYGNSVVVWTQRTAIKNTFVSLLLLQMIGPRYSAIQRSSVLDCFLWCLIYSSWFNIMCSIGLYSPSTEFTVLPLSCSLRINITKEDVPFHDPSASRCNNKQNHFYFASTQFQRTKR